MPTGQNTEEKRKEIITKATEGQIADQTLTPTPVSEWGKKRKTDDGFIVELPSGEVAKVRRTMDMLTMLRAGKIPNPLAGIVNRMIDSGDSDIAKFAQEAGNPEVMRQLLELIDQTMPKVIVEPPVSAPEPRGKDETWDEYGARVDAWEPDEGTLSVFEIEVEDKVFIFAVAQGGAADLERFRQEQESAMGAVQAGEAVVKPTKRTGGSKSRK